MNVRRPPRRSRVGETVTAPAMPATGRQFAVGRGRARGLLGAGLAAATVSVIIVLAVRHAATLMLAARATTHASLPWAALAVVAVAVSFCGTAFSLAAASGGMVTTARAGLIELAGAFCNRVAPGGLGGTLLRVRALTCVGLPGAHAVAAVTVIGTAGGLVQAAGICVALLAAPTPRTVPVPGSGAVVVMVSALGVLVLAWLFRRYWLCRVPPRWLSHLSDLRLQLRVLARDRARLGRVLSGPAVSATARLLAFWAAAHAVGLGLTVPAAALVYLAGTALASAAPVPGGVGPAELSLTAGLITFGAAPGPALAAVLVFRVVSFWLPSAAGAAALLWLRHQGALREPGSPTTRQDGGHAPLRPGPQPPPSRGYRPPSQRTSSDQ